MRVLVTGGQGFLGRHVCAELKSNNINFVAPARMDLNLLDEQYEILEFLTEHKITHVIHLAGVVGGIQRNQKEPGKIMYQNLKMGMNIIEACRFYPIQKLVMIGTVCSYPRNCPVPFHEDDFIEFNRTGPGFPESTNAGYGLAKRTLYDLLRTYNIQYGLKFNYLIPVNMAGEFDHFDDDKSHVIPGLLKRFYNAIQNNEKEIVIWGTGMASREFLYAGDCAKAIVISLLKNDSILPINIGTGRETYIIDLVDKIIKLTGYAGKVYYDPTKPDGQPRRCLDVTRAKEILGFEAQTSLDDILEKTYKWYLENK